MNAIKRLWQPDFPFHPGRSRVFYGWIILVAGTVGILASMPGQTIGVGVFKESLAEALAISSTQMSIAYLLGTGISGIFLGWGGRLFDRYGARRTFVLSAAALGLVCCGFSFLGELNDSLGRILPVDPVVLAMTLLTLAFLLLRFTGQGMVTMVSRSMVAKWWDRRRGFAVAILGTVSGFGFSISPKVLSFIIECLGWRGAYLALGVGIAGVIAVLGWLFFRDNPEESGLKPDGNWEPKKPQKENLDRVIHHDFTGEEARKTFAFWMFSLVMGLNGLVLTAYTFHIEDIGRDLEIPREVILALFIPGSIFSITTGFIAGAISDHIRLKYLLAVEALALAFFCAAPFLPSGLPMKTAIVMGSGIAGGCFGSLSSIVWARFFGRRHLGAVTGLFMVLIVWSSAIGPLPFAIIKDGLSGYGGWDGWRGLGSYEMAFGFCGLIALVLFVLSFWADNPQRKLARLSGEPTA